MCVCVCVCLSVCLSALWLWQYTPLFISCCSAATTSFVVALYLPLELMHLLSSFKLVAFTSLGRTALLQGRARATLDLGDGGGCWQNSDFDSVEVVQWTLSADGRLFLACGSNLQKSITRCYAEASPGYQGLALHAGTAGQCSGPLS